MTMKTELKSPRLRTFYIKQEETEDVVFTLRMARTPDGFTIYAKSTEFHDFFKRLSKDTLMNYRKGWGVSMDAYNISKLWTDRMYDDLSSSIKYAEPDDYVPKTLEQALNGWGQTILVQNPAFNNIDLGDKYWKGTPNMSWLISNILDQGFVINYSQPISNRMFEVYFNTVNYYLIWLNDNFIAVKTKGIKLKQKKKETFSGKLNLDD